MENNKLISIEQIRSLVDEHFIPVFDKKLDQHLELLSSIYKLQEDFLRKIHPGIEDNQLKINRKIYKLQLSKLIKKYYEPVEPKKFDVQFANFLSAISGQIKKLDQSITLPQSNERFKSQSEDSTWLKVKKNAKSIGFGLSKTFKFLGNNKSDPYQWNHNVGLRNISQFYWREHVSQRLITLLNPMHRAMNQSTETLWLMDQKMDEALHNEAIISEQEGLIAYGSMQYAEAQKIIVNERDLIHKKASLIIDKNYAEYINSIEKAGTIELSNKEFNIELLTRKHEVLTKSLLKLEKNWANTSMVLRDDWYLELELRLLQNVALVENDSSLKQIQQKITEKIIPKFEEIIGFYDDQSQLISATSGYEQLKLGLKESIRAIKGSFNGKLIQDTNLTLVSAEFPDIINDLEHKLDKAIRNISKETTVCNNEDYNQPLLSSEITSTSIQELLQFECWPEYQKRSKAIKSKLTAEIMSLQSQLVNLGQVEEFNINVAIELLDDDENPESNEEVKDPREVVLAGLQRSKDAVSEMMTRVKALQKIAEKELNEAITQFNMRVDGLSEDDSIVALKMKIATQNAVEKSQKFREKTKENFRNFIPVVVQKTKDRYQKVSQGIIDLQKKLGLMDEPEVKDLKLSDFLNTADHSYNALPFIYKRLFRNEPLFDESYYVGRSKEQESLKTALSRFQNGHFSATIVVGEKGAGVTSMINRFSSNLPVDLKLIRLEVNESIHQISDLYRLLSQTLEVEINNLEELISHLNKLPKSIFIVENIHMMFLKKIDGFEVLKEITEVISLTSNRIFWVMSCFSYSFDFLCKTIQLSEHFRYEIRMEELMESTMNRIIKERHMVSGFNLSFQPSFRDLKSKKFGNLSETDAQQYLEEQYFVALNRLSKGNISMALAYWLSSTKEVSGNKLMISPIPQFDLTFLRNLNESSLYTLSSLIIHDKLQIQALSEVLNSELSTVRRSMQTMMEFGLIKMSGEYYFINPLLYRHCLTILKSKNIIH